MIQIRFERDGKSITMSLHGHAGMAKAGQDIVCSAATILAYTVAQNVSIMEEKGRLCRRPFIRLNSGDIRVVCSPEKGHYTEAMHLYAVAQAGFDLLQHSYPKYVKLTKFDAGRMP